MRGRSSKSGFGEDQGSGIGDQGSGSRDQGAGSAGTVDVLGLARQLIDIESTTGNEGAVGSVARGLSARPRLFRSRAAAESPDPRSRSLIPDPDPRSLIPDQRHRRCRRARGRVLHALRLRAAVLPKPRRRRRVVWPRRVRCEGHSRRANRGGRAAEGGGRDAHRPGVRRRRRARQRRRQGRQSHRLEDALPDQRRADRSSAGRGDARVLSRAPDRDRARRRIPAIRSSANRRSRS